MSTFQNIKSIGFIDGYKASNFESNSSIIKYHEEELADLLKTLYLSFFKNEIVSKSKELLEKSLKKAEEKLLSVQDYKIAKEAYVHSVESFKSFLETLKEADDINISPSNQLLIKKILHHYKMLGEKSLIEEVIPTAVDAEKEYLIAS